MARAELSLLNVDVDELRIRLEWVAERATFLAAHLSETGTELEQDERDIVNAAKISILRQRFNEYLFEIWTGEIK